MHPEVCRAASSGYERSSVPPSAAAARPASSRSHSLNTELGLFSKMSLSEKSDEEISKLLTEYGIKHGPIVDSTRKLYEKKLEVAMENAPVEPSSDKTYYREEAEEITYITYHSPVRQEPDMLKRRGNVEPDEDEESDQETEPPVQTANRTANHSTVRSRELDRKSGGGAWKVIRLLLLFAVLGAALYYAYCHVMINDENPFKFQ